jgi:Domain of unknown function (DUF7008)
VREIARRVDQLARERGALEPAEILRKADVSDGKAALQKLLEEGAHRSECLRRRMIAIQEELDWECYRAYDLSEEGSADQILRPDEGLEPEHRPAFWESSTPPDSLTETFRAIYTRRRKRIEEDANLRLIETAVFKRLWLGQQGVFGHSSGTYGDRAQDALRGWLLDRLEDSRHWPSVELTTCAQLADRVRQDADFMQVAELYRGRPDFDVTALVTELVESEAVPFLPVLRYKPTGLRKREEWERVWDLQRQEDAGESVGTIDVPPKYASADFQGGDYWRLRGKLDVPKERFVSYPHCQRETDPTPVVAWAGWDHLQQAQALSSYYVQMKEREGWSPERLTPLLAGLLELGPWLLQWHNDVHPEYGVGMGDYFRDFVREEARTLGVTVEQIRAWQPPTKGSKRKNRGA